MIPEIGQLALARTCTQRGQDFDRELR